MIRFGFNRLLQTLPVLLGVSTLVFFILHMVPGDPVDILLGDQAAELDKDALRATLGLNKSLFTQYFDFLSGLFRGDIGQSFYSGRAVMDLVLERIPATLELALAALFLSLIVGIPLGVWSSMRPNSARDYSLLGFSLLGISLPGFFLGPILIWIFALKFDLLPVSERGGFENLILPAVTLSLPFMALLVRMTRASMLDVVKEDYVLVAKAKGNGVGRIYFIHALKNAIMPVITIIGLQAGALLTGTVITETIFDWPGLGTLIYQAINERDYPVVQGTVLVIAFIYVFTNFLTDITYAAANPSVSYDEK